MDELAGNAALMHDSFPGLVLFWCVLRARFSMPSVWMKIRWSDFEG